MVARSHGLPLEAGESYFNDRWQGSCRPGNCVPIYLMALLRISDYLQITDERVLPILLHLRRTDWPVSIDEWAKHRAITNVTFETKDRCVITSPLAKSIRCARISKLGGLLAGLRDELDKCAAVLSRNYGHLHEYELDRLCLRKSCVESNIRTISDSLPYIADRV